MEYVLNNKVGGYLFKNEYTLSLVIVIITIFIMLIFFYSTIYSDDNDDSSHIDKIMKTAMLAGVISIGAVKLFKSKDKVEAGFSYKDI